MEDEEVQIDPKENGRAKIIAVLKKRREAKEKEREAEIQKRKDEIAARIEANKRSAEEKKNARAIAIQKLKSENNATVESAAERRERLRAQQKERQDFAANDRERRAAARAQKIQDQDYDWNYVGGDESTANTRTRTVDGTKEIEEVVRTERQVPGIEPTGKTDADVYNADPKLAEKYGSLAKFREAAEAFRQNQTRTVVDEQVIKKTVPSKEVITQNREDFTTHWSENLPQGMIVNMTRKMQNRGVDISPQKLANILKSHKSEKDSVKWAKENGYSYLLGGRGGASRGGSTSGKTQWQ